MAIELTRLEDLTADQVAAELEVIRQLLQEENPSLELRRGVFHDLVLYYAAALSARQREDLKRYLDARSLRQISQDPALADTGTVDDILANWGVTRRPGSIASGEVTILLDRPNIVTIGRGAVFRADGRSFVTADSYAAKPAGSLLGGPTDRLLTQTPDGRWGFTVLVVAEEPGTAGLLRKDTLVVPDAPPLGYVTSFATDDFAGGQDAETDARMLDRLQRGISAKSPGNRVGMAAFLESHELFSGVLAQSLVGYGDEEQLRDKHSILPVAFGGRVDWYVRTQDQLATRTLRKRAVLVLADSGGGGTWQFDLSRDDAPGFYEVAAIRPPTAGRMTGGYALVGDDRAVDLSGGGPLPDIRDPMEGVYSRYQTAVVRFRDTDKHHGGLAIGAEAEYDVTVRYLPLIAEAQDHVGSDGNRPYGCDILVKAPIPCFTAISFTISRGRGTQAPDLAAIRAAVAAAVNHTGFVGRIYAGHLQDVIHDHLPRDMRVGAIDMHGRIRFPDGSVHFVRSESILEVPAVEGTMVSPRTVQFFCSPEDVAAASVVDLPAT